MRKFLIIPILSVLLACAFNAETEHTRAIRAQLNNTPGLGNYHVTIDDMHGNIDLKGTAPSVEVKQLIESKVWSVNGIKSVVNDIKVDSSRRDSVSQVHQRLEARNDIKDYKVSINQEGSKAIVTGYAGSPEDEKKILDVARTTPGVSSVVNNLVVTGPKNDRELRELLIQNLRRENVSLDGVDIETSNGIATLVGSKSNTREIDKILSVIAMTPAVKGVRSTVKVKGNIYVNDEYVKDTLRKTGERTFAD